jgi:hypothetical protein
MTPAAAARVGWANALPRDIPVAWLGYRLRVSTWGFGYATEAPGH